MAEMKSCPTCQAPVEPDAIFCLKCGANVEDALFDTTDEFSDDAELIDPSATNAVTVRAPAPVAPETPSLDLEEEPKKEAPAQSVRRVSVARGAEPRAAVERPAKPARANAKWLGFAVLGVVLVGAAVWWSNRPKPAAKVVSVGVADDQKKDKAPVTWTANPRGKLSPEEALTRIRDLMRGGGTGATSLDFYRQLEKNPNGDVLEAVDNIMKSSASDGSQEWQAVECKLDSGDDPEVTARCRLSELRRGKSGRQVIDELESAERAQPGNPALVGALREARALLDGGKAAVLLSREHKPVNADIFAEVLQNSGHGAEAMQKLAGSVASDPRAARATISLLSRGGRCSEAEKNVQDLTRMAGVAALMPQIRFRSLCLGDPDNGAALAEVSSDLPNLSKNDRATLYAALAATSLLAGNVPRAVKACEAAASFAPDLPVVAEMTARCALADGSSAMHAVKVSRATPTAHVLVAARELVQGKHLKALPAKVPAWHAGGAMLRVLFALQKGKAPVVALDEARAALLLGRWDGGAEFPMSQPELLRMAASAAPTQRVFAEAVAHLLSQHPKEGRARIGFGKTPEAVVIRSTVAYVLGDALPKEPKIKGKSKLLAAVTALASKKVSAITPLLKDSELAAKAYVELVKLGVPPGKIRQAAAREGLHPDLLAGDLVKAKL